MASLAAVDGLREFKTEYQQTILVWVNVFLSICLHTGAYPSTIYCVHSRLSQCTSGAEAQLVDQLWDVDPTAWPGLLSSFMRQWTSHEQKRLLTIINNIVQRNKIIFKSLFIFLHWNSPLFFNFFQSRQWKCRKVSKGFLFTCLETTFTGFIFSCRIFLLVTCVVKTCFYNI